MSVPPELGSPGSPASWVQHAEGDLVLARLGQRAPGVLPAQVCFHAQQAAEKALKAVLLARGVPFPLTHDLELLTEIAADSGIEMPEWAEDLGALNVYAVEYRYPGRRPELDEARVEEAVKLAERAVAWARAEIG